MSQSLEGSSLDVFDTLAPKQQPQAPSAAPELPDGRPAAPTLMAKPPKSLSSSAVALVRPSARRSAPPPPPSFMSGGSGAPSRPSAAVLLAGSGKAAQAMPHPVTPPGSLPVPVVAAPPPPPPPASMRLARPTPSAPAEAKAPPAADEVPPPEVEPEDLPVEAAPAETAAPAQSDAPVASAQAEPAQRESESGDDLDALQVTATPAVPADARLLPPLPTPPSFRPASVPPASLPMPPQGGSAMPAATRPVIPSLVPTTVSPDADSTLRRPALAKSRRGGVIAGVAAAVVAAAGLGAALMFMMPGKGNLRVYVEGPQGQEVGAVDIYVDNNKICSSSPCAASALTPGIHDVYAVAPGYSRTATKGVEVKGGKDAKISIDLLPSISGFKVSTRQPGIVLEVDGVQVGALPQTLSTLNPGEHKLRFVGSDRYEPLSKTITVVPGQVEDLGDIALSVAKGQATFELASPDVRMRLVSSQGDAREIDEQLFRDHRLSVDLDTSKDWKLQACAPGYEFLEIPLSFSDGQAEKTVRVELTRDGRREASQLESWCSEAKASSPGQGAPGSPPPQAAHGGGTLNINSVPASAAVLLDGKPVGRTPLSGIKVSAGPHSIVFIHPQKGRKSASVTVGAGQTRGVGVRF